MHAWYSAIVPSNILWIKWKLLGVGVCYHHHSGNNQVKIYDVCVVTIGSVKL